MNFTDWELEELQWKIGIAIDDAEEFNGLDAGLGLDSLVELEREIKQGKPLSADKLAWLIEEVENMVDINQHNLNCYKRAGAGIQAVSILHRELRKSKKLLKKLEAAKNEVL